MFDPVLYALRGAIAFGVAALVPAFSFEYLPSIFYSNTWFFPFLGGMFGAFLFVGYNNLNVDNVVGCGFAFVVLWILSWVMPVVLLPFALVLLGFFPMIGWAIAFGIGGLICERSISGEPSSAGFVSFAVGGLAGGAIGFMSSESPFGAEDLIAGMGIGGAISGAFFGVLVRP